MDWANLVKFGKFLCKLRAPVIKAIHFSSELKDNVAKSLIKTGIIDLDLAIATQFRNSDYNSPIFHRCGNYFGKIEDVTVSTDCLEDGHPEGYEGLAVYARFHGDIDPSLMVCRMEIVLLDSNEFMFKLLQIFF